MNVAVFGADGFVGNNLIKYFLAQNNKVWSFYNLNIDKIPVSTSNYIVPIRNFNEINEYFDVVFLALGNFNLTLT